MKHDDMNSCKTVEMQMVAVLSSPLYAGECWASRFGQFNHVEIGPCTNWMGYKMGLRFRLDAVGNRNISDKHQNPLVQLVAKPLFLLS
jgi:hypothetical protein